MECLRYCVANKVDLSRMDTYCKSNLPGYVSTRLRDVINISQWDNQSCTVFVFKNGTVVSWGFKRHQMKVFLDTIRLFAEKPTPFTVHDESSYRLGNGKTSIAPHNYFEVDCMVIGDDSDELKLSLSYGFSQSVKLQYFETVVENLIEKYTPMIQALSHKGHMPISRKKIRQVIGEILGAKSEMNLVSNFRYHPKYFWQHPSLEEHYSMLERYLHIQRRVNTLNHRLDTLNEIFDMFNSYLENRHAHVLEIIIIALISMEIIFAILNIHF